jgi:hypothetical protein
MCRIQYRLSNKTDSRYPLCSTFYSQPWQLWLVPPRPVTQTRVRREKDACIRFEDKVILSKRSNPNPPFSASVLYWQIQDNKSGRQTKPDAPSVAGGWLCRPHDLPGLRASCESRVACLPSHLDGENCLRSRHGWNCPAVM